MKIEEIDAINYKNGKAKNAKEKAMLKLTIPYLKPMKPYSVPTLQEDGEAKSKP